MTQFAQGRRLRWLPAGFVAGLIACSGCGASPVSTTTSGDEATVHGRVTIKGVPAKGGTIYFDPSNASRQSAPVASAEIGKDGTYTVKTWAGENRVNVLTPETRKDPNLSTPQPFDVKSGDNTLDVAVPHP
jgi:hypothetical protein